jgi:pimeloyl-ACP methyl ester carboxylesterase
MSETHTIPVDGFTLQAVTEGQGPAVVFGHGLLYDHRMYLSQIRALAADYSAVAIDSRGHGASGLPEGIWTIREQSADYVRVMDTLEIDRAVVVGQSMGGMAALHLALDYPDRVAGMVLIDTSAGAERPLRRVRYRLLVVLAQTFGVRPWLLKEASKVMYGPTFRRSHQAEVQRWLGTMAGYDPNVIARTLHPVVTRPSVVDRLGAISVPVLVIVGEEDRTTPPPESELMAERLPDARLVTLPRTGHMAPIEQPEETAGLIREFLLEIGW